jgi:hypothetical protein
MGPLREEDARIRCEAEEEFCEEMRALKERGKLITHRSSAASAKGEKTAEYVSTPDQAAPESSPTWGVFICPGFSCYSMAHTDAQEWGAYEGFRRGEFLHLVDRISREGAEVTDTYHIYEIEIEAPFCT